MCFLSETGELFLETVFVSRYLSSAHFYSFFQLQLNLLNPSCPSILQTNQKSKNGFVHWPKTAVTVLNPPPKCIFIHHVPFCDSVVTIRKSAEDNSYIREKINTSPILHLDKHRQWRRNHVSHVSGKCYFVSLDSCRVTASKNTSVLICQGLTGVPPQSRPVWLH